MSAVGSGFTCGMTVEVVTVLSFRRALSSWLGWGLKTFSDALRTLILKHALFQLALANLTAEDVQRAHDDDEEKKHEQNDPDWLHCSDKRKCGVL